MTPIYARGATLLLLFASVAFMSDQAPKPLILIVDDETSITMTCSAILEGHGYRTAVANDGETALQMAHKIHPDLVFSDVVMPGLNGVSLAVALTEKLPGTRILLFSGNTATADILADARTKGYVFPILAKPVPIPEMLAAVKSTLQAPPPMRALMANGQALAAA
jgi:CheY-like chemotaxis protein